MYIPIIIYIAITLRQLKTVTDLIGRYYTIANISSRFSNNMIRCWAIKVLVHV